MGNQILAGYQVGGQLEQGVQVTAKFHRAIYSFIDPGASLQGKADGLNVLITGAAGKIGRALALTFASAGASNLVLLDVSLKGLQETVSAVESVSSCHVSVHALDLAASDAEAQLEAFAQVAGRTVDVCIANAGVLSDALLAESDPLRWWHTLEVNLRGVYACVRACLPGMLQRKAGTFICMSSIQAAVVRPGDSAYGVSKTAVARLVEYLHLEHSAQGIRSFSVHPGGVASELALKIPANMHRLLIDPPELAAALSLYLTTPRADFLRGRFVRANWDMEELEQRADEIVQQDLLKLKMVCT